MKNKRSLEGKISLEGTKIPKKVEVHKPH